VPHGIKTQKKNVDFTRCFFGSQLSSQQHASCPFSSQYKSVFPNDFQTAEAACLGQLSHALMTHKDIVRDARDESQRNQKTELSAAGRIMNAVSGQQKHCALLLLGTNFPLCPLLFGTFVKSAFYNLCVMLQELV
jgi:hypothetical protein